ncbi:MAG: glutamine--fructose-6-phosphate transaminase (isomerizing) [Cytophagales bacterium]|nr:glutamine--fructose-6-phosphate transaminase (isomerizing) [Armatimonadota bacterium]
MCGITGYVGPRPCVRTVIDMLRRLEYRGYDSAGVAVAGRPTAAGDTDVEVVKAAGKLAVLESQLHDHWEKQGTAIAHTRWATHGGPTTPNAHPHFSNDGRIALIHNGIIENYQELKEDLIRKGFHFTSDTDTEVLVHLVDHAFRAAGDMETAVRAALRRVTGAYSIAVVSTHDSETLYAAKTASPLILGLGVGENFLASDIPALMRYTKRVLVLEDGDFAVVTRDAVSLTTLEGKPLVREEFLVTWDEQTAEKGGYPHFMLKEIYEQPRALADTFRGRITDSESVRLTELEGFTKDQLATFTRIQIVACGTAYHAGMVAKLFFEKLLRRPVSVDVASEFRYSDPLVGPDTLCIVVSQSGETADTLAALREARRLGATILSIVNVVGSSITRESHATLYTQAGPEICVASTKAYLTQVAALYLLGLHLAGVEARLDSGLLRSYVRDLTMLPDAVEEVLGRALLVEELAARLAERKTFFYLGRGYDYAVALEAALKLKEISYLHAEAYPAGEMKHGPLALVEAGVVVVCFGTQPHLFEKMLSNLKEVSARDGLVVAVVPENEHRADSAAEYVLRIPAVRPEYAPIVAIVPMQLLAYLVAKARGREIDQPRNLAKSVTVE